MKDLSPLLFSVRVVMGFVAYASGMSADESFTFVRCEVNAKWVGADKMLVCFWRYYRKRGSQPFLKAAQQSKDAV